MQNHLDISSKTQFWTRNVRNWSKSLTESLRKVYVIFQDLSRRTHKGPYGPIWAHKGPIRAHMDPNPDRAFVSRALDDIHRNPTASRSATENGPSWGPYGPIYGPLWAHMGPPGQVLEKASTFRQLSVETFGPISHVSGPKLTF